MRCARDGGGLKGEYMTVNLSLIVGHIRKLEGAFFVGVNGRARWNRWVVSECLGLSRQCVLGAISIIMVYVVQSQREVVPAGAR